ncbi:MAG: PAS domain S-box protein, partial [Gammaproteobacteria bacterium]
MDARNKDLPLTRTRRAADANRHALALALQQAAVGTVLTAADADFTVTHANKTFCELTGQSADALLGEALGELLFPQDGRCGVVLRDLMDARPPWRAEACLGTSDGSLPIQLTVAAIVDEDGTTSGYVATFTDLRGIKQAEQWNRMLLEVIEDLSTELDLDTLGRKAVGAAVRLTAAEIGMAPLFDAETGLIVQRWDVGLPPDAFADGGRSFPRTDGLTSVVLETGATQLVADYPNFERAIPENVRAGFKSVLMVPIRAGDQVAGGFAVVSCRRGHEFGDEHIPVLEAIADQLGVAVHRQRLVEGLVASEARFRKVVETVPDILFVLDPDTLSPTLVSPAVEELLGFTPEEVVSDPELWRRQLHVDDRNLVLSALTRAMEGDNGLSIEGRLWHKNLETVRWFSIRVVADRNDQGRCVELVGVLRNISARKHAEQVQLASIEHQQETLVKTIECLARAMEKRDPYTSGHQYRVAQLAVAIAESMNLDTERVEGIRLGALIHDVGKIYVPAEILNRPGRLTDAEFALIRTHSEVGFEIVEGVDFPWPVADMIRQHH